MRGHHWLVVILVAAPVYFLFQQWNRFGWSAEWLLCLAGLIGFGLGLFLIVRWHAGNHAYRCPKCAHVFTISTYIDFANPHCPGRKSLRCPACGKRSWCKEIARDAVIENNEDRH